MLNKQTTLRIPSNENTLARVPVDVKEAKKSPQ